jgi:hypothetical protein
MWDRICAERYGVTDPKARRFRYGVQVNSLGLTEAQPENNVQRIVLEALGVTLSKSARTRSLQLPAWNEALGLPHPWDQQWSLRIQQVLAYETDLLEYDDIFDGSHVIEAKTKELHEAAKAELDEILALGGEQPRLLPVLPCGEELADEPELLVVARLDQAAETSVSSEAFARSATTANAAGSDTARSARDLRSSSIPARRTPAMNLLYDRPLARAAALIRTIQSERNVRFLTFRSR